MNTTGTETFTLRRGPCPYDSPYHGQSDLDVWLLDLDEKYEDGERLLWERGDLPVASAMAWAERTITDLTRDTVHVIGWRNTGDGVLEAEYKLVIHTLIMDTADWSAAVRTCAHKVEADVVMDQIRSKAGLIPFDNSPHDGKLPGHVYPLDPLSSHQGYLAASAITSIVRYRTVTDRPTAAPPADA